MAEARGDPCVVIVEDEPQIRRFLRAALAGQSFRVHEAGTGADGLVEVASRQPDVVVLDLGLPDLDGLDVIRKIREWSAVPVIVLSARGQETDKVAALDAGADDYLSKPFGVGELMARMRVALRHRARVADGALESAFTVGELHVDLAARRVTVGGAQVHLTPSLGAAVDGPGALPARVHGAPAPQARGRRRAAALSADRGRRGLSSRRRVAGGVTPGTMLR